MKKPHGGAKGPTHKERAQGKIKASGINKPVKAERPKDDLPTRRMIPSQTQKL